MTKKTSTSANPRPFFYGCSCNFLLKFVSPRTFHYTHTYYYCPLHFLASQNAELVGRSQQTTSTYKPRLCTVGSYLLLIPILCSSEANLAL